MWRISIKNKSNSFACAMGSEYNRKLLRPNIGADIASEHCPIARIFSDQSTVGLLANVEKSHRLTADYKIKVV